MTPPLDTEALPRSPAAPWLAAPEVWAVPCALAAAFLAGSLGPVRFLLEATVGMEMHEVGHALVYWLGGVPALPLPMVTISLTQAASPLFILALVVLWLWLRWALLRAGCDGLSRVAVALLGAQLALSGFASTEAHRGLVVAAGQGGELVLGAFLCALFPVRFPKSARWPRARWFFLACGAASYGLALRRWLAARTDPDRIPWGSFWGGDGDLERLQAWTSWPAAQLVRGYVWLGLLCGALLLAAWARSALPLVLAARAGASRRS